LKTKETHKQPEARKTWRYHLTTMLYDQDYSEQGLGRGRLLRLAPPI
jgi:hypothetical protein